MSKPDWRDPQMPVLRTVNRGGKLTIREFEPDKVEAVCQYQMDNARQPNWRDDPTYNLRRTKGHLR